ncbi:MAG: extracellular solute-binding protein [Clostridiaceae bacterium]|nr:extracellular solute-binding protein [Clostridiaceae bacterium]
MKNIRKLLALLLVLVLAISVAACGGGSTEGTTTAKGETTTTAAADPTTIETEGQEDITLSFMAGQDWIQDAELDLAKKYEEETGVKIDYQIVPADQYTNLMMTKLNTGEGTDIFGSQSGKFDIQTSINVEKNAVDLSDSTWASKVEELAAAELSVNGKIYGQPIQDLSAVWAVAYNKKIFEDNNLEIPTSYDEFKQLCETIKGLGIIPIYEAVSDGWHHTLWFPETCVVAETNTPGLADKLNNNEVTFKGDKTFTTILTQINEMAANGYWGDNYMSNQYADAPKNIASGEYAMTIANQGLGTEVNAVDPNFPVDQIGYFVAPLADNQTLNVNPSGPARFIFSGSKNIDAAKAYLEYLATDESLTYLTENVGKFNKLAYSNAPSTYSETIKEFYDRYPKSSTVYQTAVKYVNPQWMEIGSSLSAMLLGEMSEEEVLEDIDKNRAEQAKAASDEAWN